MVASNRFPADFQVGLGFVGDRILGLRWASEPTFEPLRLVHNWQDLVRE